MSHSAGLTRAKRNVKAFQRFIEAFHALQFINELVRFELPNKQKRLLINYIEKLQVMHYVIVLYPIFFKKDILIFYGLI